MEQSAMVALARAARRRAYAPYSGFAVGAAILTAEGKIFTGCNIENASYGLTVCAERVALWSAIGAGHRKFKKIAIAAAGSPPPLPCGACRQVLHEAAPELEIIAGNLVGEITSYSLKQLLPLPFGGGGLASPFSAEDQDAKDETWRLPVTLRPLGRVVNNYHDIRSIPDHYRELLSEILIDPGLEEGLYRLNEEKEVIVIGYLHRAAGYVLKEPRSGRGGEVYGIFACRAPLRPNQLSHTVVELVRIEGSVLTVRGLDLINGTPVLDLKTVLPRK